MGQQFKSVRDHYKYSPVIYWIIMSLSKSEQECSIHSRGTMLIYKPLQIKFNNRLEAKRYFGQAKFNKLLKNKDNFEFIHAICYDKRRSGINTTMSRNL